MTDLDTICNVRNSVVYDNLVDIGKVAVPAVDEQLSLFLKRLQETDQGTADISEVLTHFSVHVFMLTITCVR